MGKVHSDYDSYNQKIEQLEAKYSSILKLTYGFETSEGWFPILEEFFQKAIIFEGWFKVVQIKEKFGSLRIYIDTEDDMNKDDYELLQGLISEAEFKASRTCFDCGARNPPDAGKRSFYPVCGACYEKTQQRRLGKS